jgi:hypothetical protein
MIVGVNNMRKDLKIMLMDGKLTALRENAKCRCEAVGSKLNKTIKTDDYDEMVHLCCWVCCDCHIDKWECQLSGE